MASRGKVLVTGAGGFIGCHLLTYLKRQGYWVRGTDLKYPDFSSHNADDFLLLDLRRQDACLEATRDIDEVYALASDTGGSGFLSSRKAGTTHNNVLIGLHTLEAARTRHIKRLLYASPLSRKRPLSRPFQYYLIKHRLRFSRTTTNCEGGATTRRISLLSVRRRP